MNWGTGTGRRRPIGGGGDVYLRCHIRENEGRGAGLMREDARGAIGGLCGSGWR